MRVEPTAAMLLLSCLSRLFNTQAQPPELQHGNYFPNSEQAACWRAQKALTFWSKIILIAEETAKE